MRKGLIIATLILVGVFLGIHWIIKGAFGPIQKTVEIKLKSGLTLLGEETYNADFAGVFYDIDFSLLEGNPQPLLLGEATFPKDNWADSLEVQKIGRWYILPVNSKGYSKLLLNKRGNQRNKEIIFSPLELRYDSLWKSNYSDIPDGSYYGSSKIKSIMKNRYQIQYKYRISSNNKFSFFNQVIEYELDSLKGEVLTRKIFEREQKKAS